MCTRAHRLIEAFEEVQAYGRDYDGEFAMVTILIDHLPLQFTTIEIYELLKPFCPFRVYVAADACGTLLGFAFALFLEEASARKAQIALGLLGMAGRQLCVTRAIAPRTPGELTG